MPTGDAESAAVWRREEIMLKVGDEAPLFVAPGSDGDVDLGRLLKDGAVVLYFFPRALTPG